MPDSEKSPEYFFLTRKEEEVMKALWASEAPLSAAEIAEKIPDRTWPAISVQNILRTLEKKQAVEVAEITKIGKSYGRLFRPALSANEYAVMQFKRYYQSDDNGHLSLLSALLGENLSQQKNQKILEMLRSLLEEYKE